MIIAIVLAVCFFLLLVATIEHYAATSRFPPSAWILVAGVAYGYISTHMPALPVLALSPDITFFVFLPVLLFSSARTIRVKEFTDVGVASVVLAFAGACIAIGILTLGLMGVLRLDVMAALLLASALAGTDPVAIGAVLHQLGVPRRMEVLIEAESMLNDGITVLLFAVVGAVLFERDVFVAEHPFAGFLAVVLGGGVIGLVAGYGAHRLLRSWRALHDHFVGVLFPLIVVYLVFLFAEHVLHVSGIIAVMALTITLSSLHQRIHVDSETSPSEDLFFERFWHFISTLVNAIVFFVLGAMVGAHAWNLNVWVVPGLIALLLMARALSVYACGAALWPTPWRVPWGWQHGVNLAGLKGSLSVALLLQLPADYEQRLLFLCAAFVLVLFTLTVNPLLVRRVLQAKEEDALPRKR